MEAWTSATQVQAAAKTRMDQANDAVNNSADKYAFLTLLWTLANTEEYKGTKEKPGILYLLCSWLRAYRTCFSASSALSIARAWCPARIE